VLALAALGGGIILLLRTRVHTLLSWRSTLSIAGILALLPIVQFWHATSFVPAHLNTTVGADVKVTGRTTKAGDATGQVEIAVRNSGGVGALILASELILCYWAEPHELLTLDELYASDECETQQLLDNLTEVDSGNVWTIRRAFQRSAAKGRSPRTVQANVFLWYARKDRLRIGEELQLSSSDIQTCRQPSQLWMFQVQEESRYQGIVQRDRRFIYLRTGDSGDAYFALTTVREPICILEKGMYEGLPRQSDHDVGQRVGLRQLRLDHEAWLEAPNGN
jgi:hypothetical protein